MFFLWTRKKPKKPSRPPVLWEERWSIGTVGGLILVLFIGCLIYWPTVLHWEVLLINYATFFPLVLDWEQFGSDINVLYTKWYYLRTSVGLVVARRTVLVSLHCTKCKVWWRGVYGVGLFFRSWARSLGTSERKGKTFWTMSCSQILGNRLGMAPSCLNMTPVHRD